MNTQEHDLIQMLAHIVANLADDTGWNIHAQQLRDQSALITAPSATERALRQALTWCVVNDGECLADHRELLRRFREIAGLPEETSP